MACKNAWGNNINHMFNNNKSCNNLITLIGRQSFHNGTSLTRKGSLTQCVRGYGGRGASSRLRYTPSSSRQEQEEEDDDPSGANADGAKPIGKMFQFANHKQHQHKDRPTTPTTNPNVPYDRPFKHVVVPGKISPRLPVPDNILKPAYATGDGRIKPHAYEGPFEIKSAKSIQGMRESCALARKILDFAGTLVKVIKINIIFYLELNK
jgi:hypothetical protein